jgi:hypothetical protein
VIDPVWLDTEDPQPLQAATVEDEWAVQRPKDMAPVLALEDDPVFIAESCIVVARQILAAKSAQARRAAGILAKAQLVAMQAKEELDEAVQLCVDALWNLCEVQSP